MKSVNDEELILHYYGESDSPEEVERMFDESPQLRDRFDELRRTLDSVPEPEVPDMGLAYSAKVWNRLEPNLRFRKKLFSLSPLWARRWALVGVGACLIVLAFMVGRYSPREQPESIAQSSQSGRERILFLMVADHLERSEMLLLELINAESADVVDLEAETNLAGQLRSESRLYRHAATEAGEHDVADLLESLEVVLVELAHSPNDIQASDLETLRTRLETGDLLFRVRVLGSRLRRNTNSPKQPEVEGKTARDA